MMADKKLHFVHRYDVIRVKVAVMATDHVDAMKQADACLSEYHPVPNQYRWGPTPVSEMVFTDAMLPTWLEAEEAGQAVTGYLVDEADDEDNANSRSYSDYGLPELSDPWGTFDEPFDRAAWALAVANNETSLGYQDWAHRQMRAAALEAAPPGSEEGSG